MITELRKIIALLIENNKTIAEQLLVSNQICTQLLDLLQEVEVTKSISKETCNGGDDSENATSETVAENENLIVGREEKMHNDKDIDDCVSTATFLDDGLQKELEPIVENLDSLIQCVNKLCAEDDVLYQAVGDLKVGYKYFIDTINRDSLGESLVMQLSENGWVNIVIRLYAYSRIETFKYKFLNDLLKDLYDQIVKFYCDNKIFIDLPNLLDDEFDNTKYEYNNECAILIDSYCEISPSNYIDKVYDIIQAGYTTYNSGEEKRCYKPIVFYYC